MSLCVVERSPGLPFSGTVPRVRSTRTGQAAWPKVRTMRSSGVGLRGMRNASRSAANAATPCAARVAPAATRRGTRPLTRSRPVQTATNPRTEPEAARRLCQTPDGIAHVRRSARPPANNRQTIGPPMEYRRAGRDVSAVRPARPAKRASCPWQSPPQRVGIFGRQIGPAPASSGADAPCGRRPASATASARGRFWRGERSLRFASASHASVQPTKLDGPAYRRSRASSMMKPNAPMS